MDNETLRLLAYHEAGHAVVAEALTGKHAPIRLEQRGRALHGTAYYSHSLDDHSRNVAICLAGAVAQVMARRDAGSLFGAAWYRAVADAVSDLDTANVSGQFTRDDFDRAAQLVRAHWAAIEQRAAAEIAHVHGQTPPPQYQRRGKTGSGSSTPAAPSAARPAPLQASHAAPTSPAARSGEAVAFDPDADRIRLAAFDRAWVKADPPAERESFLLQPVHYGGAAVPRHVALAKERQRRIAAA